MNYVALFVVVLFTALGMAFGYELCFEDTVFGGYFPWIVISLGTPAGYFAGLMTE